MVWCRGRNLAAMDITQWLDTAEAAIYEAGKAIMSVYESADYETEIKSDASPVTAADKLAHRIIAQHLEATGLPLLSEEGKHMDYSVRSNWDYFWLVDPLDGTKEFIRRNGEFTVNIALIKKTIPVAGLIYVPCKDVLYRGAVGIGVYKRESGKLVTLEPAARRLRMDELMQQEHVTVVASRSHLSEETKAFIARFTHSELTSMGSSLKFMLLAENSADIYPRLSPTMEWDTAAAHAIVNAAGRGVYQVDLHSELSYNKPELLNPSFIAF